MAERSAIVNDLSHDLHTFAEAAVNTAPPVILVAGITVFLTESMVGGLVLGGVSYGAEKFKSWRRVRKDKREIPL